MRLDVCFAAMIPATRATDKMSPLARALSLTARNARLPRTTRPEARATLAVAALPPTSTMEASPRLSTWLSDVPASCPDGKKFSFRFSSVSLKYLIREKSNSIWVCRDCSLLLVPQPYSLWLECTCQARCHLGGLMEADVEAVQSCAMIRQQGRGAGPLRSELANFPHVSFFLAQESCPAEVAL